MKEQSAIIDVGEARYALADASAKSLFLEDIVSHLSSNGDTLIDARQPLESALISAVSMNNLHATRHLLTMGASASARTRYFGSALEAAARHGFDSVAETCLENVQGDIHSVRFYSRSDALGAAATAGHERVVRVLLCKARWTMSSLNMAIKGSLRAHQESIAILLIRQLRSRGGEAQFSGQEDESYSWYSLLRTAAESGCEQVIRALLNENLVLLTDRIIELSLEDASRHGNANVVRLLLSKRSTIICYTGPLYWSAYSGHKEIMDMLLDDMDSIDHSTLVDILAGAASKDQQHIMHHLLERFGALPKSSEPMTFLEALNLLLDATPTLPRTPQICRYYVWQPSQETPCLDEFLSAEPSELSIIDAQEPALLAKACSKGNIKEAKSILSGFMAQYPDGDLNTFSRSCMEAAIANHPGILYYLCQYIPTNLIPRVVLESGSAALMNVFFDLGWKINDSLDRASPPFLGCVKNQHQNHRALTQCRQVTSDEFLTRWLLDRGADPNSSCGWGYTPLTNAVRDAPLSTIMLLFHRGGKAKRGQLLQFAARRERVDTVEIMELLLTLGANINAIQFEHDPTGWVENKYFGLGTALHYAATKGRLDVVCYLLSKGADRLKGDSRGKTALDLAKVNNNNEIARLLGECNSVTDYFRNSISRKNHVLQDS